MTKLLFVRTPIASVMVAVLCFGANIAQGEAPPEHPSVLTVRKMDCPAESAPAVLALTKIPGVKTVAVDYKTGTLSILPKRNAFPAPVAIWEAAERANLEPIRLATAQGTFESKPRRQ